MSVLKLKCPWVSSTFLTQDGKYPSLASWLGGYKLVLSAGAWASTWGGRRNEGARGLSREKDSLPTS